jgi:hypothetical protein
MEFFRQTAPRSWSQGEGTAVAVRFRHRRQVG